MYTHTHLNWPQFLSNFSCLERSWGGDREWKYCATSLEKRLENGIWSQDEELANMCNVLRSRLGSGVRGRTGQKEN